MKLSCEKAILLEALNHVSRVVPTRTTLAALEGLLLEAEDGLKLTGYNLEVAIVSKVSADIVKPGRVVVGARLLVDIVRKMPDLPVVLELSDAMALTVTCGSAEYVISSCLPADSFPELPSVEGSAFCTSTQSVLKDMIGRTLFAVSDNENKVIQTGALFRFDKESLMVAAVDGYRLALRREPILCAEARDLVVPGQALREVERILEDNEEKTVALIQSDRHLSFTMGDTVLISRLLSGKFLNFDTSISQERPISVKLDCEAFRQGVERVSLIISEKIKSPVRLLLESGQVTLSSATTLGRAVDTCEAEVTGCEKLEIGFNHRYILDALRALPKADSHIEFNTSLSPCVIVPDEGNAFLFMILPVRLHAE